MITQVLHIVMNINETSKIATRVRVHNISIDRLYFTWHMCAFSTLFNAFYVLRRAHNVQTERGRKKMNRLSSM